MTVALTLKEHEAAGRIAEDWAKALEPVASEIAAVDQFLHKEHAAGEVTLPKLHQMYRAFERPLADVRVLIVGQDPYPTPGHSIGLAFAVQADVRPLPRSLKNMYKELEADLGISQASHGDLTSWADQGVMLLNRVLSVRAGAPASHRQHGWELITEQAVRVLAQREAPLVVILWGNQARSLAPLLTGIPIIESAHPSPLSASRGFFRSRPFSRANEALAAMGANPVNWTV